MSLRFAVKDIPESGLELSLGLDKAWFDAQCVDLDDASLGDQGLHVKGRIDVMGQDEYLVRGQLKGSLRMKCVRCLEPAEVPVDTDFGIIFVDPAEADRRQSGASGHDAPGPDDDFVAAIQDGYIDIRDELREELYLVLPMNPKCEPPCLGICPQCGANRASQACACEEEAKKAQSPFAALAGLTGGKESSAGPSEGPSETPSESKTARGRSSKPDTQADPEPGPNGRSKGPRKRPS